MTIKPDPAKTIFWSRLSMLLHSNGIKPQREKKLVEEERKKNPPRLLSVKNILKLWKETEKNPKQTSEMLKELKYIKILISFSLSRNNQCIYAAVPVPVQRLTCWEVLVHPDIHVTGLVNWFWASLSSGSTPADGGDGSIHGGFIFKWFIYDTSSAESKPSKNVSGPIVPIVSAWGDRSEQEVPEMSK